MIRVVNLPPECQNTLVQETMVQRLWAETAKFENMVHNAAKHNIYYNFGFYFLCCTNETSEIKEKCFYFWFHTLFPFAMPHSKSWVPNALVGACYVWTSKRKNKRKQKWIFRFVYDDDWVRLWLKRWQPRVTLLDASRRRTIPDGQTHSHTNTTTWATQRTDQFRLKRIQFRVIWIRCLCSLLLFLYSSSSHFQLYLLGARRSENGLQYYMLQRCYFWLLFIIMHFTK